MTAWPPREPADAFARFDIRYPAYTGAKREDRPESWARGVRRRDAVGKPHPTPL
jgi:hypothetical protein